MALLTGNDHSTKMTPLRGYALDDNFRDYVKTYEACKVLISELLIKLSLFRNSIFNGFMLVNPVGMTSL